MSCTAWKGCRSSLRAYYSLEYAFFPDVAKSGSLHRFGNTCVLKVPSIKRYYFHQICRNSEQGRRTSSGVVNIVTGPGSTIGNMLATHLMLIASVLPEALKPGLILWQRQLKRLKKLLWSWAAKIRLLSCLTPIWIMRWKYWLITNSTIAAQACGSPGRYYIHESVYDTFLQKNISIMPTHRRWRSAGSQNQHGAPRQQRTCRQRHALYRIRNKRRRHPAARRQTFNRSSL